MTQPANAAPVKKGCGPVLVLMITIFSGMLGFLAGAGGLYAFLHFSDSGVERLGLTTPVAVAAEAAEVSVAASSDGDSVYALAYPIQETIQIQGELDESAVRNRLTRDRFVLQECYLAELERSPSTRGELSLQFTVSGSSGKVVAAVSRGNYTGSDGLSKCVLDKVRTWSFPPPETSQVAVVRFDTLFLPFRADEM